MTTPPSNARVPASDLAEESMGKHPIPTGIEGLDFVLQGGLPAGRPTLLRGAAGTGKTVIALTFLCKGIAAGDKGVLVTFDESPDALLEHAEGFGFPARRHRAEGHLRILDMRPDRNEVQVGDTIELTAILARIGHALDSTGATRLVVDAIDAMEAGFESSQSLRAELTRVFDWIRDRGVTSLITTGEHAQFSARYGLEDYIADCVIALKQEVSHRVMTRVLRVVKRRGRGHGTNEYPFLLNTDGLFLVPVTGSVLGAPVSEQRLSTGIPGLDAMLGGQGLYQGSTILLSGQAGTGKTSIACSLTQAACAAGIPVLYLSFEESVAELTRNQRSLGIDIGRYLADDDRGTLVMLPIRAVELGLEEHLMRVMHLIKRHRPALVVLDPVSSLAGRGDELGAKEILLRLLHLIKEEGITAVATELLSDDSQGVSHLDVSSMIDVWIKLRRHEHNGEMNRLIHVVKARGLPISDQVKEFRITGTGLRIEDPYIGEGGIVYGTARLARQTEDEETIGQLHLELDRARRLRTDLDELQAASERLMRAEQEAKAADLDRQVARIEQRLAASERARAAIGRGRA
ncbi:circadian clock protein KaiC [Thiocapsa rosea]|uniref:non-specific serine/threonine protein kinase n=1 Tax=Thiocapsa rosea TaxID=69360 RepID=A0A495V8G8_9GAMM|nr:circadian clock protein KaiC [Thiocapsa rosea]RKT44795.1 circadian clock protein KaiC [Thiocapsa rosea]